MHSLMISLIFIGVVTVIQAIPYEDEIITLPLFNDDTNNNKKLPSPQFSGYLNGTDGCNTAVNGPYCYIHYWFCLADDSDMRMQSDRTNTREMESSSSTSESTSYVNDYPVILWLNGGPGSSSVLGLLQELGPLLFNATGDGFMINPYSWTKLPANVFVIESPIGVGYSYCSVQEESRGTKLCVNTDKYTASTSRAAIVDFFINKFPEFRNNPFYITGESYAGVYIPTLSYEIQQYNNEQLAKDDTNNKIINLVGIAVGDPCTDNIAQQDSMDALWYSNKYGLMDDQLFDLLWNTCQIRVPYPTLLRSSQIKVSSLNKQQQDLTNGQYDDLKLFQNLRQHRHDHHPMKNFNAIQAQLLRATTGRRTLYQSESNISSSTKDECDLAYKKFLFSSSYSLSQGWDDLYIDDYSLYSLVSNDEDNAMEQYMNRLDVRKALHVTQTSSFIRHWPMPDAGFDYTKEYNACNDDAVNTDALSMIDFYRKIIPNLPGGTWIYNGDTDPCVSYEGTRTAVKRIGIPEVDGGGYRAWFYNHTATTIELLQEKAVLFGPNLVVHDAGIQFGGEVINYEEGLSFITIHGSGHMVPQFRPQAAFHMLSKLVNTDGSLILLSPLLPSNATLLSISDDDFYDIMDNWTIQSKIAPYVS